jgi:hypothetical protein
MLVGFNSDVYLFPESDSTIVLLSPCVALNDRPGWIGHLLMQAQCDNLVKHDFVAFARETADAARDVVPWIERQLGEERGDVLGPQGLDRYVGKYYNEVRTLCIWVRQGQDGLWMGFQGIEVENYRMRHYNGNVFEWLMTRDEMVRRGGNPIGYAEY